jgi:hypothetical protein
VIRAAALSAIVLLSACAPSPLEKAKSEYAMVEAAGDPDDLCKAAQKVREAALQSGDQQEYSSAEITANYDCMVARTGL